MQRDKLPALVLLGAVILLSGFGLVMLYSVTADMFGERYLRQQVKWIAAGLVLAVVALLFDYRRLGRWSYWLLGAAAAPLLYLALVHFASKVGVPAALLGKLPFIKGAVNGAYRWLDVFGYSVQPSEFAKLALILAVAQYYSSRPRAAESFRHGVLYPALLLGPVVLGILLGGSLSVSTITTGVLVGMAFVAGVRLRYFALPLFLGILAIVVVVHVSPARMKRLTTYRNPELHASREGYQLWQAMKAMGSGGWTGVGFNQSRMKEFYLPEAHTDFILSIAGEELGFFALTGVLALYLVLVGAALLIAAGATDRLGMLLGAGLGLAMGLNAIVNVGVVTGALPTTGITAPFISYGGSSLIVTWAGIGLLLNIARVSAREREVEEASLPYQDLNLAAHRPGELPLRPGLGG